MLSLALSAWFEDGDIAGSLYIVFIRLASVDVDSLVILVVVAVIVATFAGCKARCTLVSGAIGRDTRRAYRRVRRARERANAALTFGPKLRVKD